jgi:hypothetical protein
MRTPSAEAFAFGDGVVDVSEEEYVVAFFHGVNLS